MVDSGQSTIIGPSIIINGNLQGDEDLTVLGRVEGTVNLTKTLNVAESGVVKADITVKDAIVSGVVVGNITASDSVEITEAGRMVGDIRAPRVIIVDGARFRGTVDMGDLEAPRPSAPLPARTVSTKSAPAKVTGPVRPVPVKAKALPAAPAAPAAPAPAAKTPAPASPPPAARPTPAAKPAAPVATAVPISAPIAAKKKIKKKVVVKHKDE